MTYPPTYPPPYRYKWTVEPPRIRSVFLARPSVLAEIQGLVSSYDLTRIAGSETLARLKLPRLAFCETFFPTGRKNRPEWLHAFAIKDEKLTPETELFYFPTVLMNKHGVAGVDSLSHIG